MRCYNIHSLLHGFICYSQSKPKVNLSQCFVWSQVWLTHSHQGCYIRNISLERYCETTTSSWTWSKRDFYRRDVWAKLDAAVSVSLVCCMLYGAHVRSNKYGLLCGDRKKTDFQPLRFFRRVRKIARSGYWLRNVCLSVRMEQLGSYWTDFLEIWHLNFLRRSVETVQGSLKYDKNNGYFTLRPTYIYSNISLSSS